METPGRERWVKSDGTPQILVELAEDPTIVVECRFCPTNAVAIFAVQGCFCHEQDTVQALCPQHIDRDGMIRPMLLVDIHPIPGDDTVPVLVVGEQGYNERLPEVLDAINTGAIYDLCQTTPEATR